MQRQSPLNGSVVIMILIRSLYRSGQHGTAPLLHGAKRMEGTHPSVGRLLGSTAEGCTLMPSRLSFVSKSSSGAVQVRLSDAVHTHTGMGVLLY